MFITVENGRLVLNWEMGSGPGRLSIDEVYVNNGERHDVSFYLLEELLENVSVRSCVYCVKRYTLT